MYSKLMYSKYCRPIVFVMIAAILSMSFTMPQDKVVLMAGTNIPLETVSTMNSATMSLGEVVDFRVLSNIIVDNKIVIAAGTMAKGQVTRTKKNGLLGSPGEVEVRIQSVKSVDGQEIYLTGGNIYNKGEDRQVVSIILTAFLCVFCLFIKGKNAEVPAGTQIIASVATEVAVSIE